MNLRWMEAAERKAAKERKKMLEQTNALPTAKEITRIGRKKGRHTPPKYDLTRRTEE